MRQKGVVIRQKAFLKCIQHSLRRNLAVTVSQVAAPDFVLIFTEFSRLSQLLLFHIVLLFCIYTQLLRFVMLTNNID